MQELYIDTPSQLLELCNRIQHSPWLALDTEFIREKTYAAELCLIQICNGELSACIDTLALKELTPLLDIFADQNSVKIFHSGYQDLEIFYQVWGQLPANLFDTQTAAALVGIGEQIGYANLVEQLLGLKLEKGHTRTDWSHRPLHKAQLRYALDDVIYLEKIYVILKKRLQERQRDAWMAEEIEKLSDPSNYVNSPDQMWQHIRGLHRAKGLNRAVLQALSAWREVEAERANRPRRWILKDEVLLELARRMPADLSNLEKIRGLEPGNIKHWGDELLKLIADNKKVPKSQWPISKARPSQLSSEQIATADRLLAYVHQIAQQEEIPPSLLINRRELERLVRGERELPILKGWRRTLVGEGVLERLN
ncbi:MAG: ribonuclease D [Candidatus Thiodiazotropha sp. L084R]